MNILKRRITIIIISFFYLTNIGLAIEDSIYATIGDRIITQSDIRNEMKIILILNGQSYNEEMKKKLQSRAINSTIRRNIKKLEIGKYPNLQFNPADADNRIKELSKNLNIDLETLKKIFKDNEIEFSEVRDQIETELLWNSLIFALYNDKLSVNSDEIEEQLNILKNKKEIDEYLISEIILNPISKDILKDEMQKIKNRIKTEGFEQVAKTISISETAMNGGDLGWVKESSISKKFKSTIIKTPVGGVSEAVFLTEGILIFKIREKRSSKKFQNLEELKNELVSSEKTKILNMYSLSHYDNLKRAVTINLF